MNVITTEDFDDPQRSRPIQSKERPAIRKNVTAVQTLQKIRGALSLLLGFTVMAVVLNPVYIDTLATKALRGDARDESWSLLY